MIISFENQPSGPTSDAISVWIGLDWADKKHCLVEHSPGGAVQTYWLEQKPSALDQFFLQLRQRHPQGRIGVCLEQSRGPVIYALMKYDFLVLYPVNPRCLADFRRVFTVSGCKSDPQDSELLCHLGRCHHDRLRALRPQDPATRELQLLVEHRRGFVDQNTSFLNQLKSTLKCYYPLVLELMGDNLDSQMAREFLKRWPNLAKLKAAKPETLRSFFYKHNSRSEDKIEQRLKAIQAAIPLTEDPALIQPLQFQMETLVNFLAGSQKAVAEYDERISEVFSGLNDAWLFESLPGAGPALAPRLAAAFGTMRENFPSAENLQCQAGVAPVRKQSGGQETAHFRYARPKFVHQTFVEFAKCSVIKSQWAGVLYDHLKQKGKSSWEAYRIIAFKWIRILWACWSKNTAYNEAKYIERLRKKGVKHFDSLYSKS